MAKQFVFYREGTPEYVIQEAWWWEIVFADGTVMRQFDTASGLFHQFSEVDQSKAVKLRMVHDTQPSITLCIPRGAKLIHFYRNGILNAGTPYEQRVRLYCFGYEYDGQTTALAIDPNNNLTVTNNFNEVTHGN